MHMLACSLSAKFDTCSMVFGCACRTCGACVVIGQTKDAFTDSTTPDRVQLRFFGQCVHADQISRPQMPGSVWQLLRRAAEPRVGPLALVAPTAIREGIGEVLQENNGLALVANNARTTTTQGAMRQVMEVSAAINL